MVGNDILDLRLTLGKNTWKRTGFLDKIFSKEEQDLILKTKDPELTLWILWTMKESAYKAHQRRFDLPRKFNPKTFQCQITDEKDTFLLGKVSIAGHSYLTKASIYSDHIYCFTRVNLDKNFFQKIFFKPTDLKLKLIEEISQREGLPARKLSIEKSAQFIPFLMLENKKLFCNFSMTHHGDFSAFIVELTN